MELAIEKIDSRHYHDQQHWYHRHHFAHSISSTGSLSFHQEYPHCSYHKQEGLCQIIRSDVKNNNRSSVSDLFHMVMKLTSIYMILQSNIDPSYQVAMVSALLACIVYVITANAILRWQKLFK
jgi:purine nucleoside permease